MVFVFYYFFDELNYIWSQENGGCLDGSFSYWFISFIMYCPLASILSSYTLRRIFEARIWTVYVLYEWKVKVDHFTTEKIKFLVPLLVLDVIHLIWALSGLIVGSQ